MARRRSANPERIDTPHLRELRELLRGLDADELPLARHLATHELARRGGFADEQERASDGKWQSAQLAMSEADLTCREQTGERLRTVADYREHRPEWAPSSSALLKMFEGWAGALEAGGLREVGQPEAELTKRPGSPALSRHWREDEFVAALALVSERFRGRLFSEGAYEQAREALPMDLPTTNMMRVAWQRDHGSRQGFWDTLRQRAIELVLARPEQYPEAAAYRQRLLAVDG